MRCIALCLALVLSLAGCSDRIPAPTGHDDGAARLAALPPARIALMSGLALAMGEAGSVEALVAGEGGPHPLYTRLAAHHAVDTVDRLDQFDAIAPADRPDLVLLVQPRRLAPDELVALDAYLRGGGKELIFVDPWLEWPSRFALADPRAPPRVTLLSPLFGHWGLELIDPDPRGSRRADRVGWVSAGRFVRRSGKIGDAVCTLSEGDRVARCRVGQGRAILVADADLLQPALLEQKSLRNSEFVFGLIADLLAERAAPRR